jgi:electron transfer flavoprotein alpha subunit
MGQILVFSENDKVAYELLGKGLEIGGATGASVAAAVLGSDPGDRAREYLSRGAQRVYVPGTGKEALEPFEASTYASALAQIAEKAGATVILLGCTRRGKELAGRLAQKLGAGCINDVNGLEVSDGQLACKRYALGGATVSTQAVVSHVAVISVMPATFEPAAVVLPEGDTEEVDFSLAPSRVRLVERQSKAADSVDIAEAKTLVCVGMGLGGPEKVALAEELAKALGGEVGGSKPVITDQKWLPEARMIGLSGKKCKPQLAVCMGVSGQVQFIVGIREAKSIVAINTDESATIFQYADYGIVGDLNEVVPKLTALLK